MVKKEKIHNNNNNYKLVSQNHKNLNHLLQLIVVVPHIVSH